MTESVCYDGSMSPYLDPDRSPGYFNAGLKVGWAKHHLRLLDQKIGEYLGGDPKPYSVSTEDDLDAGEYVIRFDLEPPPIDLALIAGDFVACLRGSLDHLATALTLCSGGVYYDRASFPIIGIDDRDGQSSLKRAVKGVPGPAVDVIKTLQPYHAGERLHSH